MSNEHQYLSLLKSLVNKADKDLSIRDDRTGTGTYSLFGTQLDFDLSNMKVPILTTKSVPFKTILHELYWMYILKNPNTNYLTYDFKKYKNVAYSYSEKQNRTSIFGIRKAKMDNTDLRIVKTRRTIQNALIDLLEQKSYEDINVQDIVTAALVNRTTFYRHYASKSELADEMIQSFKAYYAERLAGRYSHEQPMAFFRQHFPEFYARRREILALWQIDNRRHHLYADMQAMLQHTFLHHTEALPLHNRPRSAWPGLHACRRPCGATTCRRRNTNRR